MKALVIGMGVLIVLGTALVIGLVIKRIYDAGSAPVKAASGDNVPGVASMPLAVRIPASPGATIGGMAALDGRLAIWIKDGGGGRVVLVDPQSGKVAGTMTLSKQ